MPVFQDTATHLARCRQGLVFVIPAVSHLQDEIEARASTWPGRVVVLNGPEQKFDAMAASQAGIAASGTVSLELALARVPHIVAYRLNPLTLLMVRLMGGQKQKYVNLINILVEEEIIPELILGKCRGDLISQEVLKILERKALRERQATVSRTALDMLHSGSEPPSLAAARVVLDCAEKGKPRGKESGNVGAKQ